MLTPKDLDHLKNHLHNFYHIPECNTQVFGEPFLQYNFLYYFDGFVVTIIGNRLKEKPDSKSLNKIVDYVIRKYNAPNIILWGEFPKSTINPQKGYQLNSQKIESWKRELVVPAKQFQPSGKYKNYLNKARKEKLKLNFIHSQYYKSEHLKLLFNTHKNHNLDSKSLSYYCRFPGLEKVKFVEILKGKAIISINIVIDYSPQYVCLAEIGYDNKIKNCTGLSKALLFEHYIKRTKYLSWGGSASQGIFKFKKEFIGNTPHSLYDNYEWHEFYKKKEKRWWLMNL